MSKWGGTDSEPGASLPKSGRRRRLHPEPAEAAAVSMTEPGTPSLDARRRSAMLACAAMIHQGVQHGGARSATQDGHRDKEGRETT